MPRFKTLDAKTGRSLGLVLGLLFFALALLEGEEKARALGVLSGILFAIGYIAWDFRRKHSFWLVMIGIAALHLMVAVLVPWQTSRVPGFVLVPIFFGGFCFCFSLAYFVLTRT